MLDEAEVAAKQGLAFCPPSAYDQYYLLNSQITEARQKAAEAQAKREADDKEEAKRAKKRRTNYTHLLNADVLLCIAEQGLEVDPHMGLRLAGVCSAWRNVVVSHAPLWRRLVLTRRRPVAKLAMFVERGKRLSEVTLRYPLDDDRLARELRPQMRDLKRLTFDGFSFDQIVRFTDNWRGACAHLTDLTVKNSGGDRPTTKRPLFFGLLDPDATSLRSADVPVGNTAVYAPQDVVPRYGSREWLPRAEQLSQLKRLRLHSAELHMTLGSLLALMPALEWAELDVTAPLPASTERTDLPFLKHLHLGNQRALNLNHTSLPSLEALSLYRSGAQVPSLDLGRFRSLTSLDVGFCYIGTQFVDLLRQLPKLRFLGLAGCSIQTDLLEHLVVTQGKPALLPELCALSLAANDEITAGPVRRIVLSRNLGALDNRPKPQAPAAKSPFAPAAGPFAPKRSKGQPVSRSQSSNGSKSLLRASSTKSLPPASAPPPPSTAAITFLILDHCQHQYMDTGVLHGLKRYVGFVSFGNPPTVSEDRIRGRGAFDWTKVRSPTSECYLKKREAEDSWYVHHNCKMAKTA